MLSFIVPFLILVLIGSSAITFPILSVEHRARPGGGGAIVVVGNASSNNFYLKLILSPPFRSRMPLDCVALSTVDINKIRDWII